MASMGALTKLALRCKRAMSEKGVRARLQNEEVGTNKVSTTALRQSAHGGTIAVASGWPVTLWLGPRIDDWSPKSDS